MAIQATKRKHRRQLKEALELLALRAWKREVSQVSVTRMKVDHYTWETTIQYREYES